MKLTPTERRKVKLSLELQKPLPPDLAQVVLVELGLAYGRTGKQSLAYQDALTRRNQYILAAFEALPGRPWPRCGELVNRITSGRLGDDKAGQCLKQAESLGAKMPSSLKMLAKICGLSARKN
ncbi:hypothetical protein [Methylomicrobium sp. Wu6]|uniref:hypothetical protein n=1 Tax=Methylomicrobium sp. Wu6 TaxID=3107928 RepID=UPI002DD69198|nr:hypothetical protein [Methylomicrobium sp. Wu6]MEC4747416.1 hypothetical protein [Methylomicrobium sp. Wu6]